MSRAALPAREVPRTVGIDVIDTSSIPGFESLTEHDKSEILSFATFLQKRAAEKAAGVESKNSTAAMEVYGDFNGE